jgi:hypothetical protein
VDWDKIVIVLKCLAILITTTSLAWAAESSPTPQALILSPFPNGLEYRASPEPSNSANPLLSDTRHVPSARKSPKASLGVRGGANNSGGAVGVLKKTVGTF